MSPRRLRGVIAAITTPLTASGSPDPELFAQVAESLLSGGCDGLNVLGTTGEATSFTAEQRIGLMESIAAAGLPLERMMVGTGAAALGDAVRLTRTAAELGFAGALVLPPFYYKGVPEEGVLRYFSAIVEHTRETPIPIYLYHFPTLSGVPFEAKLVQRLVSACGGRIAGLKDSSGDLGYARGIAALDGGLDVFPSNEASLMEARSGAFAGCISATANVNAPFCARGFHGGDEAALATAVSIRTLFDGKALVPGVKALLAYLQGDERIARVLPPLVEWPDPARAELIAAYRRLAS